jgi:hypothetical protein
LDEHFFPEIAEASKKGTEKSLTLAREKCNKCDLIAAPPSLLIGKIIMIGPGGLLLVNNY